MRRIRPLKPFSKWFQVTPMSLALAGVICTVSYADTKTPTIDPPAALSETDWSAIDLTDLDEQLEMVVKPPTPAEVPASSLELELSEPSDGLIASPPEMARRGDSVQDVFPELTDGSGTLEPKPDESPPSPADTAAIDEAAPEEVVLQAEPRTLPPAVAALQASIENCLRIHGRIRLNSGKDSCWSMMHSFLGWGPSCEIRIGSPRGPRANAMAWVSQNQPCGGRRLLYLDGNRIRGREGPGYQGHPAQFLAMLAQCNVDASYPLRVNGRDFTVADLIEEEKRTCSSSREMTFKLLGLVHYLGTDAQWTSETGESWDMAKIVGWELGQPVNGAACGGTHRIMALNFAVEKRKQEGGDIDGHWWRAEKYITDYQQYTMTLQNRDGSFSSDWFRQRADEGDMERGVQTTGHILEWLVFSLPRKPCTTRGSCDQYPI